MKRTHLTILAAMLLVAAIVLAGCNDNRTKISSILERTDSYMNREVLVGGKVTKTYAVNLFIAEAGAYQVDDGTGKIWVITKNGVPQEGQTVGLKGTVSSGVKLGRESFGAVLREIDRQTR
jgi:hypothetical protein